MVVDGFPADNFTDDLVRAARQIAEMHRQGLLEFARTSNPEATLMPQVMVADLSTRNHLRAEIYVKPDGARGSVVLKRHRSGEGYRWLISDGHSCFIDLGLVAGSLAEAKRVFSSFFRGNGQVEVHGYSRWYRSLI